MEIAGESKKGSINWENLKAFQSEGWWDENRSTHHDCLLPGSELTKGTEEDKMIRSDVSRSDYKKLRSSCQGSCLRSW